MNRLKNHETYVNFIQKWQYKQIVYIYESYIFWIVEILVFEKSSRMLDILLKSK